MNAAIVTTAGQVPQYGFFTDPVAGPGEQLIKIKAAALHPIVKAIAAGKHYSAAGGDQPFIAGVDGVGTREDRTRVYFGSLRKPYGTMAEYSVLGEKWCAPLPDNISDSVAAAVFNPAMSSWLALKYRGQLQPGETVLILGATGVAGKLAVQVAKELGAGKVIAAGRNKAVLAQLPVLGADVCISLDQSPDDLIKAFAAQPYDVVIDYLWGAPVSMLLAAITGKALMKEGPRTRLVQVGAMAGDKIQLPAEVLRSSRLEILGSGGGSIAPEAILSTFPEIIKCVAAGKLSIDICEAPLKDVAAVWNLETGNGSRMVLLP
ncbi:quinone oxidoreductase family protein [Chitinophaga sp. 22321]|uniref:Zinc-binding alcohol dehydrogenase family protein n=1 Tax=Chitinophaga hostae TaxID=2831022 RepID=A0ABS5IVS6_9BACT|nr:zinc-binding alcohol dehydrogenase family protein [Chitinophaga hostae]MBS0027000.1 zinc-binding alcohol dehydrogenase family protein [Chitinophaga hostae]